MSGTKTLSAEEVKRLTEYIEQSPDEVQRLATRPRKHIEIVEPDPTWPEKFKVLAAKIHGALGDAALSVDHVGSTSVPGLAAKSVIDINLAVADANDEDAYVSALQTAGFLFLLRERWHDHRFFGFEEPYANLHVYSAGCPEIIRLRMFRDWLKTHPEDRQYYMAVKQKAAAESEALGEALSGYHARKHDAIEEIYARMFKGHGIVSDKNQE